MFTSNVPEMESIVMSQVLKDNPCLAQTQLKFRPKLKK